jgi:glucose-6-phosphate isomerase
MPDVQMTLDVTNVMADAVGDEHGLTQADLDGLRGRLAEIAEALEARRGKDLGFMTLPGDAELVAACKAKGDEIRSWASDFCVLGIGGSALGNTTLNSALCHPFHNDLPAGHPSRNGAPRLHVLDNVDPALLAGFTEMLGDDSATTVFNVISKSGSTAETMSQFLFIRDLLKAKGLDPARHIVATTDPAPEKSILRRIATAEGYDTFPLPANVGGRFSILTAVGLLNAAVAGVDLDELMTGAAAMDDACRTADGPAALWAAVNYLGFERGKPISVLMPYSNALRTLSAWFCQLWAESLGKRDGLGAKDVYTGPTPVGAVGVTDQHSVMQLFQDGTFDKLVTLVEVDNLLDGDQAICPSQAEDELAYLTGDQTFGKLMAAELSATRAALRDKRRPNATLRIPAVTPRTLGELFMFFEWAVSYAGYLWEVDAYDQPGVELGKIFTYGLMGREGFDPPKV